MRTLLRPRAAAVLGFAGVGIWLVLYAIAATALPGYNPMDNFLSDLGHPQAPGAWAFNGAAIIAGIILAPFAFALGQAVGGRAGLAGGTLATIASAFLVLVGIFPEESPNNLHFLVSSGFFLVQLAGAVVLMVPLHGSPMFGPMSAYLAAVTIALDVVFIVFRAWEHSFQYITEHTSVAASLVWTLWNAGRFARAAAGGPTSPAPSAAPGRGPPAP